MNLQASPPAAAESIVNGASAAPTGSRAPAGPTSRGLTEAEALRRRRAGQGNAVAFAPSRTYGRIVRDNAFMSINVIIFAIGLALILMGLLSDAIVTVGLVLLNVAIAVVQEIRAKQTLDRIAVLSRVQATVIRDGEEREIDPEGIVLGDVLVAGPGDQVMVDGIIVADGHVEVDESLLTGEADPVSRTPGDPVYSGSFVINGTMRYEARQVGMSSMANSLTARARAFHPVKTPLQREVNLVLRLMVILILVLGGPIVLDLCIRVLGQIARSLDGPFLAPLERAYQGYSVTESVRAAAVVAGLLPQGLALMLTVSYAMGALRLAGRGALLQQANAIESMSHVDVLCFDKTGTLTSNRLAWQASHAIEATDAGLRQALADYAATTTSPNRTIEAIVVTFPGTPRAVQREILFSSARKWSAIAFADGDREALVLGAPDVLIPQLHATSGLGDTLDRWTRDGLRVLLLARSPTGKLGSSTGNPSLPADLVPLGLIAFRDELQPGTAEVIAHFEEAGVALKIISGDYPETVAALARQAGFGQGRPPRLVSGLDLAEMPEGERARLAETGEIFGRITPEQKLEIVRSLQARGHYVAMVGDGVNDVLALKQAQLGIAMQHGSQASRAVSDIVLLGNAFSIMPAALQEGQRIVGAAQDLLKLFLSRSLSMVVVILAAGIVGTAFPLIPTHNALPALLTVGVPTLALAAWARPGRAGSVLLRSVLPFALPAALSIGAVEGMLFITYARVTGDVELARTVLTSVAVLGGLLLIVFVKPPTSSWSSGDTPGGDRKPTILAAAMLAVFLAVLSSPGAREFFELAVLSPRDVVIVLLAVTVWALGLRYAWRANLLRRWLGSDI